MLAFGEYMRQSGAGEFFSRVFDFLSDLVKDWNQFRDNITLSYNGVREDSSYGAGCHFGYVTKVWSTCLQSTRDVVTSLVCKTALVVLFW